MGIQNPIGGSPKDPYENYRKRADEIERERKQQKEQKGSSSKLRALAKIIAWTKQTLDFFTKPTPSPDDIGQNIILSLTKLGECLETLKWEDRSQDPEFLSHFSTAWNDTLKASLDYKQMGNFSAELKTFLKDIQTYPKNQDHSLGYYLTEHAGQDWLPRPYTELIQKMHYEYKTHPEENILTKWILSINNLLLLLAE